MKNSWFFAKDKFIRVMCEECHEKLKDDIDNPWFWPGSVKGYANQEISCFFCGTEIYNPKEKNDE